MGLPKWLGGNQISDEDPLQVTGGAGIGTPDDLDTANTVIGLLKRALSRWPAALGQATAAASTPVVLPATQVRDAAALGDAEANATVPGVGAYLMAWTGSAMRRVQIHGGSVPGLFTELVLDGGSIGDGATVSRIVTNGGSTGALAVGALANNGTNWDKVRTLSVFKPITLSGATAETTVWTPTSGKKFRFMRGVLTASAQTILTFKDNTSGTTIWVVELAANVPFLFDLANGILSAAANNVLTVTRGTSAVLNGTICGTEE